jgi:hypothetical protein
MVDNGNATCGVRFVESMYLVDNTFRRHSIAECVCRAINQESNGVAGDLVLAKDRIHGYTHLEDPHER